MKRSGMNLAIPPPTFCHKLPHEATSSNFIATLIMGNYLDTPQKKYACASIATVAGLSLLYYLRRSRPSPSKPQDRKSTYLEVLDRTALTSILKQIRKTYSEKLIEVRRIHRSKRRSLESPDLDIYRTLVMRYNASIVPIFEEVRDRVLSANGVTSELLQNSIDFYEVQDPDIANLAATASVPFNNV